MFYRSVTQRSYTDSSWVRNTSEHRMSTDEQTTASVLALPTFTEPPSTVYPIYEGTLEMMKAKKRLLMILIYTIHELNACCKPAVRSSGESTWPIYAVA